MKVTLCAGALFIALGALALRILQPPAPLAIPASSVELHSVVLVVPGQSRSAPVDLTLERGYISDIRPARAAGITGYILPGLADAHIHGPMLPLPGQNELFAFLYLYHGVTSARMAAGDARMRDAIDGGEYPGPRVLSCGPFLDGKPPLWPNSLVVTDEPSAEAAVEQVAAEGYDCIKVYNELTAEASREIYQAAKQRSLAVIGHVPWRQNFDAVYIDDIQHLVGWAPRSAEDGATEYIHRLMKLKYLDQQRVQALIDASLARGFALTPTLVTLQRKFALSDYADLEQSDAAALLPSYYRDQLWHPQRGLVSARLLSPAQHDQFRALYPQAQRAVRSLYEAGVALHSGTDSAAEFIVPGAGLLEELQLLQQTGLTPEQVLEISSVNTVRYLHGKAYGRLSVGAPADFVVYAMDPTQDLANLDTRTAVVRNGVYFERNALEEQLQRYQVWFNHPAYRVITTSLVSAGLFAVSMLSH
ncbi:amidohydrolase family protein [Pseudohalioglobus sediminis]|nr:amidohydrolase family protein [Pseudohalioglobus sediminis]